MERALLMCAGERHVFSSASLRSETIGQDTSRKASVQINGLRTQFFERSVRKGQVFFKNELLHYVADLARRKNGPVVVVPAVWTLGGGPRTYPGGVKRWQWKRRQRKDERILEKDRLFRERQIFKTRRREELRKTSPPVNSIVDNPVKSSEASEATVSSSHPGASLLSPRSFLARAAGMGTLGEAAEGRQVSYTAHGNWIGTRAEVAEQIRKVRDIVSNKYRQLAGPSIDNQTTSSFSKLPLSPSTLKALTLTLDIRNMTPLQEATFPRILQGNDMVAQTKVAGEDIIASLIYALELVLLRRQQEQPRTGIARLQQNLTVSGRSPVTALLLCPTEEIATFVASEARLFMVFHPDIRVQVVKGGNDLKQETWCLKRLSCQIVVATPGRFLNHLQSSPELRGQFRGLRLLVLMEVQKLLEMGYRRTIERILPMISRLRQTLMWSSSQSDEVLVLAKTILKKNHQVISLSGANEADGSQGLVRHDFLMVKMELHLALIFSLINAHVEREPNYKVVVFCQTVRTTTFLSEAFKNLGFFTCELHMRKNDKHRERAAAVFRTMKGGVIMFTCGASVWGVSNPDVTLILQIGQPTGPEQYVRRVAVSGQETRERECILLLMPFEQPFLKEMAAVPLRELGAPELNSSTLSKVQDAVQHVDSLIRVKAYLAWLRYHIVRATSTPSKEEVVELANVYATVLGFNRPPQLNSRTTKALGLKGRIDNTDFPKEMANDDLLEEIST